jgi:hypothetical protein
MKRIVLLAMAALPAALAAAQGAVYEALARPTAPGVTIGFASDLLRLGGGSKPLTDFTIGTFASVRHAAGVDQQAFAIAAEAWARPGSRSLLVGIEAAVINEEPDNHYPKIANNAVIKNRADVAPPSSLPMNANSIAYWVSAQPGTGFERGLVFDRNSLLAIGKRPAVIDLSDLTDEAVAGVDLIRIRKDVALRYDPVTRLLALHFDAPAAAPDPSP